MGVVIKYAKGDVAHKTACVVYPDRRAVEVQLKGHKLQIVFKETSFIIKELDK